jgi:hypothetical protein
MDINLTNLPILRKEETIKEIEPYETDPSQHNVFLATLHNKQKNFLIQVLNSKLTIDESNLRTISKINNKNILKVLYLITKNNDTSYICFEFSEILLSSYISCALPDLNTRLLLLKQCTELIIHFKKMNIKLDKLDSCYIFVESLENPVVKVLYHGINN